MERPRLGCVSWGFRVLSVGRAGFGGVFLVVSFFPAFCGSCRLCVSRVSPASVLRRNLCCCGRDADDRLPQYFTLTASRTPPWFLTMGGLLFPCSWQSHICVMD